MAVLVDEARWPWRDRHWAHLVSDRDLDELHEFARLLGKRRLGFQGDHYDVDTVERDRAVALGAEAVPARELVRRLRSAGLRRSGRPPRWRRLVHSPPGSAMVLPDTLRPGDDGSRRVARYLALSGELVAGADSAVFAGTDRLVVLCDLAPGVDPEPHAAALRRILDGADELVVGEPRLGGDRSVEILVAHRWVTPPPLG